jgi:hypothetical protein
MMIMKLKKSQARAQGGCRATEKKNVFALRLVVDRRMQVLKMEM